MKIHPIPPRLDTCSVMAELLAADAVTSIVSAAQRRYAGLNSSPPWSEVVRQKKTAIQKSMLICLYQALADWLKAKKVARRELGRATGSIGIRSPAKIQEERAATELDLAFLFAALAISQGYHASLMVVETGGAGDALLALTAEPDIRSAIESGIIHKLNFSPAFKKYRKDNRGSDCYYEASCHDLKKHDCYLQIPLESRAAGRRRFAPYLERAVFNVLTKNGIPNGTGFFVARDGHALTCHHVLKDEKGRPVYDKKNRFTIRFLNKDYACTAEWFPHYSHEKKDVAVVKVRVDQKRFPEFNTLPLGKDYIAGLKVCLRGFDRPDTYPTGSYYDAKISSIEKKTAATISEEEDNKPNEIRVIKKPTKNLIKLTDGTFVPGMSGSPVVRMDTGRVFAVQRAWDQINNWGLCIPVKTFLQAWREYSPTWPDVAFDLI